MKQNIVLPEKVSKTIEASIDPHEWILVPGTNRFVHISQQYNDLHWASAVIQAQEETPFAVTPLSLFSPHYANVCATMRRRNPATLYDGTGEPLSRSMKNDLYEHRTEMFISLDTCFEEKQGALWVAENHKLVGDKLKPQTKQRLQRCVKGNNVLVDLVFNTQKLPTRKSRARESKYGKNLYFYEPRDGCIAAFNAVSRSRVDLYCDVAQQSSYPAVGVLLYAEGVAKK